MNWKRLMESGLLKLMCCMSAQTLILPSLYKKFLFSHLPARVLRLMRYWKFEISPRTQRWVTEVSPIREEKRPEACSTLADLPCPDTERAAFSRRLVAIRLNFWYTLFLINNGSYVSKPVQMSLFKPELLLERE